jgi:hypothetical protein
MAFSNKVCIAPKDVLCGKRGQKFKLEHHFVPKCKGDYCRYLIRLNELPEFEYIEVKPIRR